MYLKKLEMQGFKSFAGKIVLEFGSGITAIVGPNGSGKSNISDAVRWVLGEQSAKSLRGSKMEDVIFSGTQHRKPVGFSEVSITIDNSDEILPIEYSEVTITRRVFRSGESEYYINKTLCRLKDIHLLFLDTGIGKDGYSMIGQGRIDEILSNRSEDRRAIFEEASGIMKYKVRKQESERKLEQTRNNLVRINDILVEMQNQLGPLKEQAEKAKEYLDLREKLKILEVNLYIMSIERYMVRIEEYKKKLDTVQNNINEERNRLDSLKKAQSNKSERMKELEKRLEGVREKYYKIEGIIEKSKSQKKVNEGKIKNLQDNIGSIDSEKSEIKSKIGSLDKERMNLLKKLEYLEAEHDKYRSRLKGYEDKMTELLSTLDEAEKKIEMLKTNMDEHYDNLSDLKIQANNMENHSKALQDRIKSIEDEEYRLKLDIDTENMSKEELNESITKANTEINRLVIGKKEILEKKKHNEENLSDFRKRQSHLKSQLQIKTSRYRMLEDMEENLEGYNRSVKNLLLACERSDELKKGIRGVLARLINVRKEYETAIEMALGAAVQDVVTDTEEDAKRAIEYLKKNKLGRVTFLPISSVKPRRLDNKKIGILESMNGYIEQASNLVQSNDEISGIVSNFLERVAVFDNIDNAINAARKMSYSVRIVTLDGDVLNTSGSISGGVRENGSGGILGRNREIDQLKLEVRSMEKEYRKITKDITEVTENIEKLDELLAGTEKELKNNELVKIRDESHIMTIDENIKKTRAKLEMLSVEKTQTFSQIDEASKEYEECTERINNIQQEIEQAEKKINEHRNKHKEDLSKRDDLHADITNHKVSVNSISENINSVKEMIERIFRQKEELFEDINRKESVRTKTEQEIEDINKKNDVLDEQIKKFIDEKTGKTFEIDRITEERKVIEEEIEKSDNDISSLNENIILLREEQGRIEVRRARVESDMDTVKNKLWEDYELTYGNAEDLKKDIGSITSAQREIDALKNSIGELGPVNVQAMDEYKKTKERFTFMNEQRNDMEQAQTKLQRVIYEMTSIMKKKFMEQFKLINENFNIVFRELFDGGRAELKLSNDENVLESGIEIEAQPPGKKLQNMMLLSGGERALTAIALVFAILKLNPAPFCILDEIEAALDDNNVYKFADYLRKYCDDTQFIIMTHRKGTMEASDTLYGVTMEERGISKVVSIKMEETHLVTA